MEAEEITAQILSAWDDVSGDPPTDEEPETEEPTPEEGETGEEQEGATVEPPAEEEAAETEEAEPEEEAEEPEPEEGDEEPEPEVEAFQTDDPEARAFLAKYQGDVERALKGGLQMQQALSRQAVEKQALEARVGDLEGQLAEAQPFAGSPSFLTNEQREWIGQALESGDPSQFVKAAVQEKQFDLARALCAEWGNEAPYEAARVSNAIDQLEYTAAQQAQQPVDYGPVDHKQMLDALIPHFPDLPQYYAQMAEVIEKLGEDHPAVRESKSNDLEAAARGLIHIYDIARASSVALASTRESVKNGNRAEADEKRKKAVVSSAGATPSPSESTRPQRLGPGLTLEQLDEEWERNK